MHPRALGWALLAAVLAAACSGKAPALSLVGSTPQVLRVAVPELPGATDPALAQPYDSGVARVAFEGLLKPRPNLSDVAPAAAASYQVSADGLTYTFHLQPHGAWSDGAPVRARDFLYGWRRVLDPRLSSPAADLLARVVKGAGGYDGLDPVSDAGRVPAFLAGLGLAAPDDRTFVVTLDHPAPAFRWIVTVPALAPGRSDLEPGKPGPGNGPFQLQSVAKDRIVLTANAHYWGGRPRLDEVVLSARGGAAADLARFGAGREELTEASAASQAAVSGDPRLAQDLVAVPYLGVAFAQFNIHSPPFDNRLVRLAFAESIDRTSLAAALAEPSLPSQGPLPKGLADYRAALSAQQFDPAQARGFLAGSGEAAAAQGVKLLVRDLPADRALAAALAAQWKQNLGVEVALDVHPSPEVTGILATGKFQLQAPAGWLADYPEEQDFLDIYRTEDFDQWSRYSSPGFDSLVASADAAADPARRLQLFAQAQQLLAADAPVAFLYQPLRWNLKQAYVQGVTYTALDDWPGDLYAAQISIASH